MDVSHPLQTLLQFLVTDAASIAHLAYILDHLSSSCLTPSPHLQKWVVRVTSLMHSRDPAARWAAMCIAYRMSFLSKSLLVDNAQSWVGIIFPSLSKPEPVPILRISMRYLTLVLCAAGHDLEFQRQVAIPIVPRVSSALVTIAEKHSDQDIKTSSILSLARLVPLYPSLHKALSQRLFALCHQMFSSSVHHMTDSLLEATVDLYAVLHFVGGKVGGMNLWRNCLDEILQFSWSAWLTLRTTFPASAQLSRKAMAYLRPPDDSLSNPLSDTDSISGNPLTTVALSLHRLKCGVSAIGALLRAPVSRPVRVPIGPLAAFCWCLLTSTRDDEGQSHIDPHVKIAESTVVSQIWVQACLLLSCLTQTMQELLAPHTSKLITVVSSHLENNLESSERHIFLRCASHLLYFCPVVGATRAIDRLAKAAIVYLSPLYLHQPRTVLNSGAATQSRTSKKRRGHEADNVLSVANSTVCVTMDECDTLITALDVVNQCMLNVELAPSTRSLSNRMLLSILLSLSSVPPSNLSFDPSFHGKVIKMVRDMCVTNVQGTSHTMSKGTSLILRSFFSQDLATRDELHSLVDLLLHPRSPPFVRSLPFVDSLSLSSAEESPEETTTRRSLVLGNEEMHLVTSKPQTYPEPVIQIPLVPDLQTSQDPSQEQVLPTSANLHQRSTDEMNPSTETPASSVAPIVPLPSVPARTLLVVSPEEPAASAYMAPMLVDESDQEEVPTIDLGSDSDA